MISGPDLPVWRFGGEEKLDVAYLKEAVERKI
jgi:hypothetical protein